MEPHETGQSTEPTYFDFAKFLDQHPKADIFYRFLLWSSLIAGMFYLAYIADGSSGGAYIKSAIETGNKGMYWNVLGMFGLIIFSIGMFWLHIQLILKTPSSKTRLAYPATFFSKIATDILGATFGLSSGMLGSLAVIYITNLDSSHFWALTAISAISGFSLVALTFFIGALLWFLKVANQSKFSQRLKQVNLILILIAYPVLTYLLAYFLWHYNSV